jgi:TolB-like protein
MITCSDLVDTNTALKVGELLNARYIITGTIVEMNMSVVVFCRVIDVQTGAIISVSQVILPKNSEILSLL